MRALLVLLVALAGCAAPAPEGGRVLNFALANEAFPEGADVRIALEGGGDRIEEAHRVAYDPVVPATTFALAWPNARADVRAEVDGTRLATEASFDLAGQDEWWFYVAVHEDRLRLERYDQAPAYG